jgi:hypothetical protein
MKHIRKFNEELSIDDPENFDSEDISRSLADWWISCEEALPKPNQVVIVYAKESQMADYSICTFEKGISMEERRQMAGTERALRFKAADEHGNNTNPYCWRKFGPGTYFGQDVTHWMPLPSAPDTI